MAIQVNGTTVVSDSRGLNNIASIDSTTVSALAAAGVGGGGGVPSTLGVGDHTWGHPANKTSYAQGATVSNLQAVEVASGVVTSPSAYTTYGWSADYNPVNVSGTWEHQVPPANSSNGVPCLWKRIS